MLQIQVKIVSNIQIAEGYFKMCLDASLIAQKAEPGQFIYVRVNDKNEPLLRRALSIHRIGKWQMANGKWQNGVEILYKVKRTGTKILSEKKAGEELDIIGPLGNGFNLSAIRYPLSAILVAGGIGVAPLLFLAQKLIRNPQPARLAARLSAKPRELARLATRNPILILIGGRTKRDILCKKDFEDLGCEVKIATDDGSQGFKGKVTELLKNLPTTRYPLSATRIFACGPTPMLKEISKISQQYKIPCQISLEEKMACGIGVCHGCAVKIANRKSQVANCKGKQEFIYKRVCKDGPVFDAKEIIWG